MNRRALSLIDLVGDTPLLRVSRDRFVKLESQNPTRTVADRITLELIRSGMFGNSVLWLDRLDLLTLSVLALTRHTYCSFAFPDAIQVEPLLNEASGEVLRLLIGDNPPEQHGSSAGTLDLAEEIARRRTGEVMYDLLNNSSPY